MRLHRRKREAWPVLAGVVSASTYDRAETYRHSHSPTHWSQWSRMVRASSRGLRPVTA